ncbi:hypothetical protein F750_0152 [Streptomyces sp. PAMC 26508]|nr:hypothetical protein F750_0152 [Streptomyces sp. PAMC 26508]
MGDVVHPFLYLAVRASTPDPAADSRRGATWEYQARRGHSAFEMTVLLLV